MSSSRSHDDISPSRTAPSPELIPMLSDPEISIQENKEMKGIDNYSIEQLNYLLYVTSQCGKYEDVIEAFEVMCSNYPKTQLSKSNRTIIEISLKTEVGTKQKQINKLNSLLEYTEKNKTDEAKKEHKHLFKAINKEKERLIDETKQYSYRIIKLINCYWLKAIGSDKELEVFLLRIKANIYKYMSQLDMMPNIKSNGINDDNNEGNHMQFAKDYFTEAYILSLEELLITNNEHLKLIYDYANFLNNTLKDSNQAIKILSSLLSNNKIKSILHPEEDQVIVDIGVNADTIQSLNIILQFHNELKSIK